MIHAIVYSKPTCPHCTSAKTLLTQHAIPYTEYTIGSGHTKEDVQKKLTDMGITNVKVQSVPQIFYTDSKGKEHYIGGNSDLQAKKAILGT